MIRKLGRLIARHRRKRFVRKLCRGLALLHRAAENLNYDIETNGEAWVMKCLAKNFQVRTVFDVGANAGAWTARALDNFPGAAIHAFEIVPETCATLKSRVGNNRAVTLNCMGLSDRAGTVDIHYDPAFRELATSVSSFSEQFHGDHEGYQPKVHSLPVSTGNDYCRGRDIRRIEFLKVDVEGHEPEVLRGFEPMLRSGAIDVIQFEYGFVNIDVKFLLKDFYEYLEAFGMTLGKIFPSHVEFRAYRHAQEDFFGPNYLAVRSCHKDLIEKLSGG